MNAKYKNWLLQLTGTPTAPGHEQYVVRWVQAWAARRRTVTLRHDRYGNLLISRRNKSSTNAKPIYFTAHMDHPAFVITKTTNTKRVQAEFRGGVSEPYFLGSNVRLHQPPTPPQRGKVIQIGPPNPKTGRRPAVIQFPHPVSENAINHIATWDTGPPRTKSHRLWAPACDNLASVAATLAAFDAIGSRATNLHVLLTRAEEVGFIGAIGACISKRIPKKARLITLECSKSFPDAPLGNGPIVRVGDRTSTFNPDLTYQLAQIATQFTSKNPSFKWQRRLMTGGTCEATAFQAYGYHATCLCLPLDNYHNMNQSTGKISPESISLKDFEAMIRLITHITLTLDNQTTGNLRTQLDQLFKKRRNILD